MTSLDGKGIEKGVDLYMHGALVFSPCEHECSYGAC